MVIREQQWQDRTRTNRRQASCSAPPRGGPRDRLPRPLVAAWAEALARPSMAWQGVACNVAVAVCVLPRSPAPTPSPPHTHVVQMESITPDLPSSWSRHGDDGTLHAACHAPARQPGAPLAVALVLLLLRSATIQLRERDRGAGTRNTRHRTSTHCHRTSQQHTCAAYLYKPPGNSYSGQGLRGVPLLRAASLHNPPPNTASRLCPRTPDSTQRTVTPAHAACRGPSGPALGPCLGDCHPKSLPPTHTTTPTHTRASPEPLRSTRWSQCSCRGQETGTV